MNKAQEKRNRDFKSGLTSKLNYIFRPFRNHSYKSYVDFKVKPHMGLVNSHWSKYNTPEEAYEVLKDKTRGELGINVIVGKYTQNLKRKTKEQYLEDVELAKKQKVKGPQEFFGKIMDVKRSKKIISELEVNKLDWLLEAREGFNNRFDKMINTMCSKMEPKKSGFMIEVEEVSNSWNEFEVLIHVEDTTFHARAIWVNCVDKVSHYRFITTTRKR